MKWIAGMGLGGFVVCGLLTGCGTEPATAPEGARAEITSAYGAQTTKSLSIPVEVAPINKYPGERITVDYKGTIVMQGRVAMPDTMTVRLMPLDDAGGQVPHRVKGTVAIPAFGTGGELSQPGNKAYLETKLSKPVTFPAKVSLTLEVDTEIPGSVDVVLTGPTPGAFD